MKNIGITGGTGFVGSYLTDALKKDGYQVVIFTRDPEKHIKKPNTRYAYWCPEENKCDLTALKTLNGVINLAGASIAGKRWTSKRKQEIRESRIIGTQFLVEKLKEYAPNCSTFISASAIGYYGSDNNNEPFKEEDKPAKDFLADTCLKWEQAAERAADTMRTVLLRFGIVIGKDGGMYKEFAKPIGLGIKPILGSGKQIISWIQVEDLVRLISASLTNTKISGAYNAVAPNPVSHEALVQAIAKQKGGVKIPVPVPAVAVKLMLGEMSTEVLKSCTVSAQKVLHTGFQFKYNNIDSAIKATVNS